MEPTLTIAASLAFRSPFFSPFDKRDQADAVKKSFDSLSDHATLLQAYAGWEKSRSEGRAAERDYLSVNFLSRNTYVQKVDKTCHSTLVILFVFGGGWHNHYS